MDMIHLASNGSFSTESILTVNRFQTDFNRFFKLKNDLVYYDDFEGRRSSELPVS